MQSPNGSVTVNGINDRELVRILEIKVRHEQSLTFNPQQLQPIAGQQGQPIQPQHYNNAIFTWKNEDGLEGLREIVVMLLKKEEHQEKVAG
jgi:hypothetical protein